MKILMFCQYYYPESVGPQEFCEQMVRNGDQVTVVTGLPNYNTGRVSKEYKFFKKRKETINGVNVIRTNTIGRRKGKIWLSLNYLSYMFSASWKSLFLKKYYDIVYCYQLSPITMAIPASVYARKNKKKSLLYCLDLWPESLKVMDISENSIIFKVISKISKKTYKKFDKIAVSSEPFIKYFSNYHNLDESKLTYIPQFSKDYLLNEKLDNNDNNIVKFLYAGNCGLAQNIELILEAIKNIKENYKDINNFVFNIIGDGSNLEKLKEMVKQYELQDYVKFYGRLGFEELRKMYALCDVTIATLKSGNSVGDTLPLKVISYMSTKKIIIAAIDGSAKKIIEENDLGIVVSSNDCTELEKVMVDIINDKKKYENLAKNARKYYEKEFTIDVFIDRFEKCINELLGGN